jgi:ankyrin repeat protein
MTYFFFFFNDCFILFLLLIAGVQVDAQTVSGHTALFLAAQAGLSDMVQLLLSKGAAWVSTDLKGDLSCPLCVTHS